MIRDQDVKNGTFCGSKISLSAGKFLYSWILGKSSMGVWLPFPGVVAALWPEVEALHQQVEVVEDQTLLPLGSEVVRITIIKKKLL